MALILDGTNGLSDVDGSAATPAIRGSDANTGVFFGTDIVGLSTGGSERVRVDASGNVGIGTSSPERRLEVNQASAAGEVGAFIKNSAGSTTGNTASLWFGNWSSASTTNIYNAKISALNTNGVNAATALTFWTYNGSGSSGGVTERMRIDSSGNLLVGTTSVGGRCTITAAELQNTLQLTNARNDYIPLLIHNSDPTGNNLFAVFGTEASFSTRGSISYNRASGLTVYATTSDYRAKDITGPVIDSGALIDSTPVYMGKMKGATQERPMFIAHETPEYAHTGEKDAVDADGKPVYQQMDASALIPVMWAEIQSLRQRLAALESN
jgi:hypothetical protein